MWWLCACADPEPAGGTVPDPTTDEEEDPADPPDDPPEDDTETTPPDDTVGEVEPPLGATSGGDGGAAHPGGDDLSAGGADYVLIAPSSAANETGVPLLIVFSGTEGSGLMTQNMLSVAPYFGLGDALIAVLDGRFASAADGAAVLDAIRADYDVDNDRTWLLSESAGTGAGLELGLDLRQSWFAAYWANDVNARAEPASDVAALGFTPWGQAGPGGDLPDANAIVDGMEAAGYDLPNPAPYAGPGSDIHGSPDQFLAAVDFFADKSR